MDSWGVKRVAVFLLASCLGSHAGLTFQVDPKTQECFYENLERNVAYSMNFEVVRGGLLDIKLRVTDQNEQVVLDKLAFFNRETEELRDAEGQVSIVPRITGQHKFCFDNRMSRWTPKIVFCHGGEELEDKHASVAKLEHLGPVVDSVIKIADTLDELEKSQHSQRVKEQFHRDVAMDITKRVQWMSILESGLLIGVSIFQLRYIQAWFSDSNRPGRV